MADSRSFKVKKTGAACLFCLSQTSDRRVQQQPGAADNPSGGLRKEIFFVKIRGNFLTEDKVCISLRII